MKPKMVLKLLADLSMTVLLPFLMFYLLAESSCPERYLTFFRYPEGWDLPGVSICLPHTGDFCS